MRTAIGGGGEAFTNKLDSERNRKQYDNIGAMIDQNESLKMNKLQ